MNHLQRAIVFSLDAVDTVTHRTALIVGAGYIGLEMAEAEMREE